jgi:hypothetical protein
LLSCWLEINVGWAEMTIGPRDWQNMSASWPPHRGHVATTSLPRGSHASATSMPYGSHVSAMWQPCQRPVEATWLQH